MNEVTNMVPHYLIDAIKLRLNVPLRPFFDLSYVKYH